MPGLWNRILYWFWRMRHGHDANPLGHESLAKMCIDGQVLGRTGTRQIARDTAVPHAVFRKEFPLLRAFVCHVGLADVGNEGLYEAYLRALDRTFGKETVSEAFKEYQAAFDGVWSFDGEKLGGKVGDHQRWLNVSSAFQRRCGIETDEGSLALAVDCLQQRKLSWELFRDMVTRREEIEAGYRRPEP